MSRLYGNQLQAAGKRYYFALDAAPGIVTPAPAQITLNGRQPGAAQAVTVFRTPAPAILTLIGNSLAAPVVLSPAPAALSVSGKQPSQITSRTITNALPTPLETPPPDFAPTLITIWHAQPAPAQITLQALPQAVGQGGNIGFVQPGPAQISFGTLGYTLLLGGQVGVASLSIIGLAPTVVPQSTTITPDPALLTASALEPRLSLPFRWVDDRPAPSLSWITDSAA